jgi:beta-xylosidase
VVKRDGTYYLYYSAGMYHCLAVGTATSPAGPFTPRTRLTCGDANGTGYIDAAVLIDRDGKGYLYASADAPGHRIVGFHLTKDLLHITGQSRSLFGLTQTWEFAGKGATVEGPFPLRHGNTYYIFYSGSSYIGGYAMGYAASRSPLGPFKKYAKNPVLRGTRHVFAPGGGSVYTGPDGKLWMVYHAWSEPPSENSPDERTMRIDPLVWHGAAVSIPVHPR